MKQFTIEDTKTGLQITVEGDTPPTQEESEALFAQYSKPEAKPLRRIYTENQMLDEARARAAKGETPESIQSFVTKALKDRASSPGPDIPELKAYIPPPEPKPAPVSWGPMGATLRPYTKPAETAFPERGARMRQQQELFALEQMAPQLTRAMLGGRAQPSQLMTPEESDKYAEELAATAQEKLGVPPGLARAALSGGEAGDVALKVVAPLLTAAVTRDPSKMVAVGAFAEFLVQKREQLRGQRERINPLKVGAEGVLTGIIPPALPDEIIKLAGPSLARQSLAGAEAAGAIPALRAAEAAAVRAGQSGAMLGAGEVVSRMGEAGPINLQEVFDVATLGALFGGAFGALEAQPQLWSKIASLKPMQALRVLRGEPKTPEVEKAIESLQQVVQQNLPAEQILTMQKAELVREALQQRAREAGEQIKPAPSEKTARAFEPFEGVPTPSPAKDAARVFEENLDVLAQRQVEGMAPRPIDPAAAIEEAVGIRPAVAAAEVPQGYSPAAPGVKGQIAPGERVELTREARAAQAMEAFEKLPPQNRAEEAAQVLEEAAMQQDRAIANLAGRIEENFFQGRLGSEETSPTPDMDRVRKADQRLAELEKRPGKAAKETARVEAQKAEAMKGVPAEPEAAAPAAEPLPELSPQAQRMADRYGGADRQLLMGLAGGGTGFVVGWNTGEGLPPQERLARALAFGAGGAFSPTAIRRIIGMQGWANRVIKERGVGSGALNTADPQILAALSVKGAALVGEGVKNFAEWGDKMVREFGDSIRPKLKEIWAAGQEADIIPNKLVDKAPERPPRQYETPAFKTWFGKSKVVNEDGTPKVMYHGASDVRGANALIGKKDFTVFKPNRQGLIFVTPEGGFAGAMAGSRNERSRVYPLYVKAENIFDFANPEHIRKIFGDSDRIETTVRSVSGEQLKGTIRRANVEEGDWMDIEFLSNVIRKAGFDGLYVLESGYKNLAVFDPIQLKSATGNRGTYSLRNKDIRGFSTPAAMVPVAGAGAGAVIGASQGETPEEKLRYAALGAAAGAGAGAALVRGAKGMVGKGISAEPRTGAVTVSKGTPQSPAQSYETPNFKAWFKNSQVVNEDGTPRRMYHGTTKNNLTKFDQRSGGIWVAFDPAAATPGTGEEAGSVIPLFVSAQKIYKLSPDEFKKWRMSTQPKKLAMDILNRERGNGYDAVQIEDYALLVAKPTQVKSAVSNSGAYSNIDPRIAGFITKELAIPLGSFAGGFTAGYLDGEGLPPSERFTHALQWAAVSGGIGYAVARKSLKAVLDETPSKEQMKKLAPLAPDEDAVLAKTRKVFTPDPVERTKAQKSLTSLQSKILESYQNVFRSLSLAEEQIVGKGDNLLLGDAASLVAGSVGKAEAGLYPIQQAQKELIPKVSKENVNDYLFYRRVIDRLTTDPETRAVGDWTIAEAKIGLNRIRRELGDDTFINLEKFAGEVQKSADEDLQLMVRSGRMSEQTYKDIKEMNEFYAPFYALEYFAQQDGALKGMGKALDTTTPLTKAIKGITDEDFKLVDIMSSFQINKMRAHVLADKNKVMRRMAELARMDTDHVFMKDLGTAVEAKYSGGIPKGWEVVNYMEDGVRKQLAVLPEVAKAVKGMDAARADVFASVLSMFAAPLRAGATGLNLGFQSVNVFKDAARLGIMSKYGVQNIPDFFRYIGDLFVGFQHSANANLRGQKSQLYLDFLNSGAARSTLASNLTPDALMRAMQQGDDKTAASILKVPLRSFISGTEKMGNAIEETIKLAGFRRGVRMEGLGKLTGKAYDDALERLAYEVRNYAGSPDFSKHGTHGKALNALFMFANARIQGSAADLRRLFGRTGEREQRDALIRLTGGVGTLTGYLWYVNNSPENTEDYKKRSLSERNAYFLLPRYNEMGDPMYYINEDGQKIREYYRFPKFEVVGMMANVLESAFNYASERDPKGIAEMGKIALENLSPIPITGRDLTERVQSVASGLNPIIKAPLEIATNKSFFQHRDIVKQRLQGVRPEEQYLETTPRGFISLAQAMPESAPDVLRSPLYLKQLTENFTGSLFTQFMRPQLEGRSNATTNPMVARFFSAPIVDEQETWDRINHYKTESATDLLRRERTINNFLRNAANYSAGEYAQGIAEILAANPKDNAIALNHAMQDYIRGVADTDRAVRALAPQYRAMLIDELASKRKPGQDRDAFYDELARKGLINVETANELIKLKAAPPGKKTSFKEGKLYRDPTTGVMKVYRNGAFV